MGWTGTTPTAFIKVVESELVDKRKQIAAEALQAVVLGSPVDEGTYRANHRVSLDGEDLGYDLQEQDKAGGQTLGKGNAVLGGIDTPYGTATVQNNVPYGEKLENGHSKQAPQGVYGVAFEAVRAKHAR